MRRSSSSVHLSLRMSGFKWLCHLSRHCLPILPGSFLEIALQFLAPFYLTNCNRYWSSSLVSIKRSVPRIPSLFYPHPFTYSTLHSETPDQQTSPSYLPHPISSPCSLFSIVGDCWAGLQLAVWRGGSWVESRLVDPAGRRSQGRCVQYREGWGFWVLGAHSRLGGCTGWRRWWQIWRKPFLKPLAFKTSINRWLSIMHHSMPSTILWILSRFLASLKSSGILKHHWGKIGRFLRLFPPISLSIVFTLPYSLSLSLHNSSTTLS